MVTITQKPIIDVYNIKREELDISPWKITNLQKGKRKRDKITRRQKKKKMAVVNLYISIISLNVNRWNLSIKRHRLDGFLKKRTICCLQETYFSSKDTHTLKVKEWKMIFQGNGNQKMVKPYLYPIKETSSQK